MADTITIGKQVFDLQHNDTETFVDTGIKMPLRMVCKISMAQGAFTTLNKTMMLLEGFKKQYPKFTKSSDMLLLTLLQGLNLYRDEIYDAYAQIFTDAGVEYTLDDAANANYETAISYETQNILFIKQEDEKNGME